MLAFDKGGDGKKFSSRNNALPASSMNSNLENISLPTPLFRPFETLLASGLTRQYAKGNLAFFAGDNIDLYQRRTWAAAANRLQMENGEGIRLSRLVILLRACMKFRTSAIRRSRKAHVSGKSPSSSPSSASQ